MRSNMEDLKDKIGSSPPLDKNGGHVKLVIDLQNLLREAKDFQFDDFKNINYGTPKIELRKKLLELAQNVVDGRYDN